MQVTNLTAGVKTFQELDKRRNVDLTTIVGAEI
jgi:hypothetical protein